MTKRKETKVDEVHSYGILLDGREIFLGSDIDDDSLSELIKNFRLLERQSSTAVTLYLSTRGGHCDAGLGMYDFIVNSKLHTTIICLGFCHSMGPVVLQSADHRICGANTTFLLHDGTSGICDDKHQDAMNAAKWEQSIKEKMYDILAESMSESTQEDVNKIRRKLATKMKSDWYLNAQEALQLGLVDEVR